MNREERGSATLVVVFVLGLVLTAVIGLGSLAILYGARTEASIAADAAALAAAVATYPPAGAGTPQAEASRYATANGAVVVTCTCTVDPSFASRTVTVIVEKEVSVPFFGTLRVKAGARGEFDPVAWLGS
jgi:secretion/DNA translocation related TadE-like protein